MVKTDNRVRLGYALELVKPTARFVWTNFTNFFLKFLFLRFLALIISILMGTLFVFLTAFLFSRFGISVDSLDLLWSDRLAFIRLLTDQPLFLAFAIIWISIGIAFILWFYQVVSLSAFRIIKDGMEGKQSSLYSIFTSIKYRVFHYQAFNVLILMAFGFIFPLIANMVLGYDAIIFLESNEYSVFSFALVGSILFLTQFWLWELLVAEKGILESLAASLSIIRKKFISVVLFDIVSIAMLILVFAPYFFFVFFVDLSFSFAEIRNTIIASLSVLAVIVTIEIAATEAIFFPYAYSFWKAVRPE